MFAVTHFVFFIIVLAILYYLGVFDDFNLVSNNLEMYSDITEFLKFIF